ncbi:MAG: DinB family protein [Chloroflexota bacterium]
MTASPTTLVTNEINRTHRLFLNFLQKCSDKELHRNLSSGSHSIAWHVWHTARWADFVQASIAGMTPELGKRLGTGVQVWYKDGLAQRWGFNADELGFDETGMLMSDAAAQALVFPAKNELLDYVERAFAAMAETLKQLDDGQFVSAEQIQPMTETIWAEGKVGKVVVEHHSHVNRHLGTIECLLGLQGKPGSATK